MGVFFMHLGHQLFPHHHHQNAKVAAHSHSPGEKHHHHHDTTDTPNVDQQTGWLDELLSYINHEHIENPIQSGNQLKANFCKTIFFILPGINGINDFSLLEYRLVLPIYSPPEEYPKKHIILFKNRRGPPVMA